MRATRITAAAAACGSERPGPPGPSLKIHFHNFRFLIRADTVTSYLTPCHRTCTLLPAPTNDTTLLFPVFIIRTISEWIWLGFVFPQESTQLPLPEPPSPESGQGAPSWSTGPSSSQICSSEEDEEGGASNNTADRLSVVASCAMTTTTSYSSPASARCCEDDPRRGAALPSPLPPQAID